MGQGALHLPVELRVWGPRSRWSGRFVAAKSVAAQYEEGKSDMIMGITDHAQEALGDVVFVDLPKVGVVRISSRSQ